MKTDFNVEIKEPVFKWDSREYVIYGVKDEAVVEPTLIGFDVLNRKIIVMPHHYTFTAMELHDLPWLFPLVYAQNQEALRRYIHDEIRKIWEP